MVVEGSEFIVRMEIRVNFGGARFLRPVWPAVCGGGLDVNPKIEE